MPPIEGKKTAGLGVSGGQSAPATAPTPVVAQPVASPAQPDSYMAPNQRLPSQGKPGVGWNKLGLQSQGALPQPPRDYQQEFIDTVFSRYQQGQDRALLVAPTGSGKSLSLGGAAVQVIQQWRAQWQLQQALQTNSWAPANWRRVGTFLGTQLPGPQVLWVTHRDVGVKQTEDLFGKIFGANNVGVLQGKRQEVDRPIIIATAQTLRHQLPLIKPQQIGLTLLDEAHHYVRENDWSGILKHLGFLDTAGTQQGAWPRLLVGATATPDRLSGSPLRDIYGPEGLVQAIDASTLWNRADRVLLKPEQISVQVKGDVNAWDGAHLGTTLTELFYTTLNRGNQFHHTVVFVSRVAQIEAVVASLNDMGIAAEGIHADTKDADRDATWDRFKSGQTRVLVNVGVVGEIMDIPSIETVVLAFATESRSRVVQGIGRAMRPDAENPSKQPLVVDLGGNLLRHRLDIQIREVYETDGGGKLIRKTRSDDPSVRPFVPQVPDGLALPEDIVLQGDRPLTAKISEAFQHLNITSNDIQRAAYRLGTPSDILFAYANGLRVPASLDEVLDVARAVGDAQEKLRLAWADEKTAQMNWVDPLAPELSPAVRTFTHALRTGFWFHFGGATHRVPGTEPETVRTRLSGNLVHDGGDKLWEPRLLGLIQHFSIPGQRNALLEHANAVLIEKTWPLLEPWMHADDTRPILRHRLKALAVTLGRTPTGVDMNAAPGMASATTYAREFGSWNNALTAAELTLNTVTNKTRELLLADLKALAESLKRTPTGVDMDATPGMASSSTYAREFGSWNHSLTAAGLTLNTVLTFKTREQLLADLKKLAATLERTLTGGDLDAAPGMASRPTYANEFGSWNQALTAAGLTLNNVLTFKTREQLLADLKTLATTIGRTPTGGDINAAPGMASVTTYIKEFCSWNQALTAAGLTLNSATIRTREQLLADLKALAATLERTPTNEDINAAPGMASRASYVKEFGSWNKALTAAGLTLNNVLTFKAREKLLADLKTLAARLGRTPTKKDINAAPGMASDSTYTREFGSLNKALTAAGLTLNTVPTSKTREQLLADLKTLGTTIGRTPTGGDIDAALGMASKATYTREFGSLNKALTAAGLTLNKKSGFVTVDVLASPLLAPIDGAIKLMENVRMHAPRAHAAAAQTLRGGAVFFLGSLGADAVDAARSGDWSTFKKMSPKELAVDYAALTLGGEVGRRATTLAVARIPTMVMPAPIKSLAVRTGSLTAALALVNRMKTGEMNWAHLPQEVATILAASSVVQGTTAIAAHSPMLRSAAQFLKLTTTASKATFLGAAVSSVAEFVLIREISRMAFRSASEPALTEVRHTVLQLLHADADVQRQRRAGSNVDESAARDIRHALESIQQQLAAVPSVDAQLRTAQYKEDLQRAMDARDIARRRGMPDADWNYARQVAKGEANYHSAMATIARSDAAAAEAAPQLRGAAEFRNGDDDAAVALSDEQNETKYNDNYSPKTVDLLLLPTDLHIIAHQLKQYLVM